MKLYYARLDTTVDGELIEVLNRATDLDYQQLANEHDEQQVIIDDLVAGYEACEEDNTAKNVVLIH